MKALWNGTVLADSDVTMTLEGHHYFPPASVRSQFLRTSQRISLSPRCGRATFYDVVVNGVANHDAAWSYRAPHEFASAVKDHVAFWNGVTLTS